MHDTVDTKHGSFPILPDTDEVIPIHWANSLAVVTDDGRWTTSALERVIGTPGEYASRTVRLFVVLPELTVADLRVNELVDMLKRYAAEYDLNIKLTYYPGQKSRKEFINARNDDPNQCRISIDVLTDEILGGYHGNFHTMVLWDMHLGCGVPDSRGTDIYDLAGHVNLHFPRNTEYDFTVLVVHDLVNGDYRRTAYPISLPGFRLV